jgi:hypothetical protein
MCSTQLQSHVHTCVYKMNFQFPARIIIHKYIERVLCNDRLEMWCVQLQFKAGMSGQDRWYSGLSSLYYGHKLGTGRFLVPSSVSGTGATETVWFQQRVLGGSGGALEALGVASRRRSWGMARVITACEVKDAKGQRGEWHFALCEIGKEKWCNNGTRDGRYRRSQEQSSQ